MRKSCWVIVGLMLLASCKDKELDMTVLSKTLYEEAVMDAIQVEDAWNVTVVQDEEQSFVELEYSAFLEEYLQVQKEGSTLHIGFTTRLNPPANTVMNATVHTPAMQKLTCAEAARAVLEGHFTSSSLLMELEDASTCQGGVFEGIDHAVLKLNDAAILADFELLGGSCAIELKGASVLKGSFSMDDDMEITLTEASRMTTYGGMAAQAEVEVSAAGFLNMLQTPISEKMHIVVRGASEASVGFSGPAILEGSVTDASKLYYQGAPFLDVACDSLSILQPL